jgi:hypothetical protein
MLRTDIQLPFGAVYFRKSNPPKEDWDRDYGVAREDGLNIFRHWFMWGSIETAPGVYDWSDYDRRWISPPPTASKPSSPNSPTPYRTGQSANTATPLWAKPRIISWIVGRDVLILRLEG